MQFLSQCFLHFFFQNSMFECKHQDFCFCLFFYYCLLDKECVSCTRRESLESKIPLVACGVWLEEISSWRRRNSLGEAGGQGKGQSQGLMHEESLRMWGWVRSLLLRRKFHNTCHCKFLISTIDMRKLVPFVFEEKQSTPQHATK